MTLSVPSTSNDFLHAFIHSFILTSVCEFGDRTFFLAAIMSTTRKSTVQVYFGVLLAVSVITVLSTIVGYTFPFILEHTYTSILVTLIFLYFGQQLIRDWYIMSIDNNDEYMAVKNDLTKNKSNASAFLKAFSLTLTAELGDRSQLATIAIAAKYNINGTVLGVVAAHAICTAVACAGGRLLAAKISNKSITLVSGLFFVLFALINFSNIVS